MDQRHECTRNLFMLWAVSLPLAGAAVAQQPSHSPELHLEGSRTSRVEEIVVMARRKAENLQKVPTAVTAIGANDLEALKIQGFQTVGQTVPNVYIQKQGGSPAAPQVMIRGVSTGSLNLQVDSGVGMYIDGVYIARTGASAFELADLERVEVLRGPQGTLFGRNATGGAINIITAGPTGESGGRVEVGAGNFREQRYKATLNLPEWHGLAVRLTAAHSESEGDVRNTAVRHSFNFPAPFGTITTAKRGGDNDTDTGLLALRYTGIDRLSLDYRFDITNWRGTKNFRQLGSLSPCVDFDTTAAPCMVELGVVRTVSPFDLSFRYRDHLAQPLESEAWNRVRGQSLTGSYELTDRLTVKYIGSYREYRLSAGGNQVYGGGEFIDDNGVGGSIGGVWTPLFALRKERQHQQSHELQLLGATGSLDWLMGLFQFEEKGSNNNPVMLFKSYGEQNTISAAGLDYFVGQNVRVRNRSSAAYAHATWHVGAFDLSGGVRHTRDKRDEHVIAAGLIGFVLPGNQDFDYKGSNTDYDVSVTYNISPSVNVYAKHATGYVSGGSLMGNRFEPDKIKAYEIGLKSELLDERLRLNVALFRQDRTDVQIEGFTGTGYLMGRGRDITSEGVELEATFVPTDGLSINATYGYTKVDSDGQLRTYQPKQTAFLGVEYEFRTLDNGIRPSFRMDVGWRDDAFRLVCPAGQDPVPATDVCVGTPDPTLDRLALVKAVTLVNARLSLAEVPLGGTRGRVSLWGRNLLDENEIEYDFSLGGPTITGIFMRPRTYGIDFTIDF